jgi:hypothetical protein
LERKRRFNNERRENSKENLDMKEEYPPPPRGRWISVGNNGLGKMSHRKKEGGKEGHGNELSRFGVADNGEA